MDVVTMFKTSDGAVHDTLYKAAAHAENRYGDLLTKIATEAVRIEKYSAMVDFIDANLGKFSELLALKADTVLTSDLEV